MQISVKLTKDQVLMKEGDESDCLYIVKTGKLAIYKFDRDGGKHNIISEVGPGEMVGEMSFLDNQPRSASVKAISDCDLVMMNRNSFERLLSEQDPTIQNLVKTLADRLRKANQKIRL